MESSKKTGRLVGILFILATAGALLAALPLGSNLDTPLVFATIASNNSSLVLAVIFELILAISVIAIGFVMFPVLKKHSSSLGMGYVSIRLIEGILLILATMSILLLIGVSQDATAAGDTANYEPLGNLILSLREWAYNIGALLFLGLGGLFLNYGLYKLKLVPKWLSTWGLVGAALVVVYGIGVLFDINRAALDSPWGFLAVLVGLQEMVFAVWLIVKGFNPPVNQELN
ncbi:DUF4386 domain-containing protein [Patescibacteria group bacterium]|nr:DUF4386 domain-containing protein [Patescibacteria group bacterium]